MKRNLLRSSTLPKEISAREHDYSIRVIKVAGFSKEKKRKLETTAQTIDNAGDEKYEVTELFIEPLPMNVIKVLKEDGTVSHLNANIHLDEICHTDDMLELTPIDAFTIQENVSKIICLNGTCKICLKDLSDTPDKIQFYDDFGRISANISKISTALESMNVTINCDNNLPQQMCVECYNIFTKMTLFKQICRRSERALATIGNFVVQKQQHQSNEAKLETNVLSILPDVIEIKEEARDVLETISVARNEGDEARNSLSLNESNVQDGMKSFICIRCGRDFNDLFNLVQHKKYDFCVDDENAKCRVCNEIFSTLKELDHHLENSHNCFVCNKCSKSFNTLAKLNKHQLGNEKLICDICSHSCCTKKRMLQHLLGHTSGSYPCQFCDLIFTTAKRRGVHKRNVHPNELYKCPHCSKEFKILDTYRVHILKHNPNKKHKCTYCPSQFVHRHHLDNHIRTHTKEAPFLCNYCGKTFRNDVGLRDHLTIHDPKMYPCRRPNRPKKLQHCTLCDFNSDCGSIKNHMIYVHGVSAQTVVTPRKSKKFEYSCHICDKEFRMSTSLTNHMRTHDEVRQFHCTYCKASFRKANYLRLHIDGVHLNKRPNKCDQCDAAYLVSNDLRRHKLKNHSTERPYPCKNCHKKFALVSSLKAHEKVAHQRLVDVI